MFPTTSSTDSDDDGDGGGEGEPGAPSSSFSPSSPEQRRRRADLGSEPAATLPSARDAPEGSFEDGGLVFTLRPIYPLVGRLERSDWPVRVPAREFPVMLTPFSYNAATAWAALTTSLSLLAVGFVLSQALTFSVINSHSMEPTLQVRGRGGEVGVYLRAGGAGRRRGRGIWVSGVVNPCLFLPGHNDRYVGHGVSKGARRCQPWIQLSLNRAPTPG